MDVKKMTSICRNLFIPLFAVFAISSVGQQLFAQEPLVIEAVAVEAAVNEPVVIDTAPVKAVMIEFHEEITPLSSALLSRRFKHAVATGAKIIVLDIDSPGGYVSSTLELVDLLESTKGITTVAYIRREAISGAALLALAADKIAIAPQALIGDAGMIMMGENAAYRYVPEKERSYLAQRVRMIASKAGRPPSLAEAMVDKDLIIFKAVQKTDGKVDYFSEREWNSMENTDRWEKGKQILEAGGHTFFTTTGARAVELGLANLVVDDHDQLPTMIGAIGPIPVMRGTWVDTLILLLNSSFVTGLLVIIGLVALVIEFSAPGMGAGGLISIFCFGLFFWSRFLGGTSDWFELILFLIGLSFILLEIFVIPGTGVAGISGLALVIFSLVMASRRDIMPESLRDSNSLMFDILTVLASLIGFMVAMGFVAKYLGEFPILSRLALAPPGDDTCPPVASLAASAGAYSLDVNSLEIGTEGRSVGPLRPSGRIRVGSELVDVVTEGDYVEGDTLVRIVAKNSNRVVVRAV